MADMDVAEINKIRISLGMKPLAGGSQATAGPTFKEPSAPAEEEEEVGSTLESRQEEGYENYRKLQEAEKKRAEREARNARIKRERDLAHRQAKLQGKGLGEADDYDGDTKSYLKKQKRRQAEIEKARKLEQERIEEEARLAEYTAKDLAGVKVGHELDSFEEGGDAVLTLKDTTIEENEEEGDELENLDLRAREKLKENLDLKKKKPVYNPHDMEADGEMSILAQCDEEISGKKRNRFTLDGAGSTAEMAEMIANGVQPRSKPKAISLDVVMDDTPVNDYLDISEIKVKKPKKNKKKSTRQRLTDEDDIFPVNGSAEAIPDDSMDIDAPVAAAPKRSFHETSFADDDDLAASLAAQRRAALKKRKLLRPEELAHQVREEAAASPSAGENVDEPGGLVIDETSDFVANLQKPTAPEIKKERSRSQHYDAVTAMDDDSEGDGDVSMGQTYADVEDDEDLRARIKREEDNAANVPASGIEEEATLDRGIGNVLKLLRERKQVSVAGTGDKNADFRAQQHFLNEKQRLEDEAEQRARMQRDRDRQTGKLDRMSVKEREEYERQQNNFRDQLKSRQLAEQFNRAYKPTVELKYLDEHGRSLNQKEAFKEMSHQFHGKGSGKLKTEKKLKRIEDEKRREAQSLLDVSSVGGMSGAQAQQMKQSGKAGVRMA